MVNVLFHQRNMHIAWPAHLELPRRDIGQIFRFCELRYIQLLSPLVSSFSFWKSHEWFAR